MRRFQSLFSFFYAATMPTPTTGHKTHHLPKMTLPTFHGDLMAWTRFWAEFQDAVDKLPDLTESSKLAYLREAIQCPTTRALMMGSVAHSARYPEVVAIQCPTTRALMMGSVAHSARYPERSHPVSHHTGTDDGQCGTQRSLP